MIKENINLIMNNSEFGLVLIDKRYTILELNEMFAFMLDSIENVVGKNVTEIIHPHDLIKFKSEIGMLKSGENTTVILRLCKKEDNRFWVKLNIVKANEQEYLLIFVDVSEIKKTEGMLRKIAYFDELTGLYNRRGFIKSSDEYLKGVYERNKNCAIIFVDMDNMKMINDTYGHEEGDIALINLAKIMEKAFPKKAIFGRLGGDEYVGIIETDKNIDEIRERLHFEKDKINILLSKEWKIDFSVGGVVATPKENENIEILLKKADKMMYLRKKRKKRGDR